MRRMPFRLDSRPSMELSRVSSVGSAVSSAVVMLVSVPCGTTSISAPSRVKPTAMLPSMSSGIAVEPLKPAERREDIFPVISDRKGLQIRPDALDFFFDLPRGGINHHDSARRR
jgi:hypothetical protein